MMNREDSEPDDVEVVDDDTDTANQPSSDNPLFDGELFKLVSMDEAGNVTAKCMLCPPANNIKRGQISSTGNFYRHIKIRHPGSLAIADLKKKAAGAKGPGKRGTAKSQREKVHPFFAAAKNQPSVKFQAPLKQEDVDEMIANHICETMQPISVVEAPTFKELVLRGRNTTVPIYCPGRKAVVSLLLKRFDRMKQKMKDDLESQDYICTTADIWSQRNKSYIGMTASYIDRSTLERTSLALCCRRIKYSHTFDKIAEAIHGVHSEYEITSKVTHTVTDNASNFAKAFSEYFQPEESESETGGGSDTEDQETEDVEIEGITLPLDIIDERTDDEVILPPQLRCVSHTLNLIGSTDSQPEKVGDERYAKSHSSTFKKIQTFWNKLSRSTSASDHGEEISGGKFVMPSATRWNGRFDAVRDVLKKRKDVEEICTKLNIPVLKPSDFNFLTEWSTVMNPIADALDILQGEDNCFLGCVLPALKVVLIKLKGMEGKLNYCEKLRETLVKAVKNRFAAILDPANPASRCYILATTSHPAFKIQGVEKDIAEESKAMLKKECEQIHRKMVEVTRSAAEPSTPAAPTSLSQAGSFFSELRDDDNGEDVEDQTRNASELEVSRFFNDTRLEKSILHEYPIIKEVFLRYNTALPSSGPVERLFSTGGQLLTPRRNRLGDRLFEVMLMSKANYRKLFPEKSK